MNFPLRAGNIISNEPGYYKDGEYGIRIESDMLIKKATQKGNFLKFGKHDCGSLLQEVDQY